MRILKFRVEQQQLTKDPESDFKNIVKCSRNYLYAKFSFGEGWKGCKAAASFWCLGKEYPVLLTAGGTCTIPAQALVWDSFGISVTGIKDGGKYIIKTNRLEVKQS